MLKKPKLNILDLGIILTIVFSVTGFMLAKAEKTSLDNVINGKEKIFIEVQVTDVPIRSEDYLKVGESSAITIRNRPYTKLKIYDLKKRHKKRIITKADGSFNVVDDPLRQGFYDLFITLEDTAIVSNDGYVIGGNKVKIGNIIELEGFTYRLKGKISDIGLLKNKESSDN